MKQKSLRAFSLILIFALCLSLLSACGGNGKASSDDGKVNLVEASPAHVNNEGKEMAYYAKTISDCEDAPGLIVQVCPADGGIYIVRNIINHSDGTEKSVLYFAEKNGKIKSLDSAWLGESSIGLMCAAEGGGFWLIKNTHISHDHTECELGSFKNGEYSKLLKLEEDDTLIHELCAAKGRIFISKGNSRDKSIIEVYKPDGEKDFDVNADAVFFKLVSDGAFLYIANWDVSRALNVRTLDPANGDIKEIASFAGGSLLACSGEKLYIGDTTGLAEYDTASKNTRRLFLWSECGLTGNIASVWQGENGEFIVLSASVLKRMYPDVKRERKQVTLAVNEKVPVFSKLAFDFNEESSDYEVVIKDYGTYPDPQQMLNTDIISGKAPDLIDAAGFSGDMIKSGAMKDLLKYIGDDPDLKDKGLVQGALNAMKTEDGELLAIAPEFSVFTILCREDAVEAGRFEGAANALKKLGSPEEAFAGTLSRNNFLSLAFCCGGADKYSREDIAAIIEYASQLSIEEDWSKVRENLRNGKQRVLPAPISAATFLFYNAIEFLGCGSFKEMSLLGLPFREGTGVLIPKQYFTIPANAANADGA